MNQAIEIYNVFWMNGDPCRTAKTRDYEAKSKGGAGISPGRIACDTVSFTRTFLPVE